VDTVLPNSSGTSNDVPYIRPTPIGSDPQVSDHLRVVNGLRTLGADLEWMSTQDQSAQLREVAVKGSAAAHELAGWLESCDPALLLDEVTTLARRSPGTFLAIALGGALTADRLTRGPAETAIDRDPIDNSPYAGDTVYVDEGADTQRPL
jgi:hypothetical protein